MLLGSYSHSQPRQSKRYAVCASSRLRSFMPRYSVGMARMSDGTSYVGNFLPTLHDKGSALAGRSCDAFGGVGNRPVAGIAGELTQRQNTKVRLQYSAKHPPDASSLHPKLRAETRCSGVFGGETLAEIHLKHRAIHWARSKGISAIAAEAALRPSLFDERRAIGVSSKRCANPFVPWWNASRCEFSP